MSYGEFKRMMNREHVPDDAFIIFRTDSTDSDTEHDVTRVVEQKTFGDLHYCILGGYDL